MTRDIKFRRIIPRRKPARSLLWLIGMGILVTIIMIFLRSI